MRKKFLKDFIVDDDVISVELLECKIEKDDKKLCLVNEMLLKKNDLSENHIFKIELDEDIVKDNDLSNLNVDRINCIKTYSRVTIFGELSLKHKQKDDINFKINPFKESLLNSFISFKRDEVDVVTTLDDDIKHYDEVIDDVDMVNFDLVDFQEPFVHVEEKKAEDTYEKEETKDNLLKDVYTSSIFYYRIKEGETISDILSKFNMSEKDFLSINKAQEYKTNSLIRIKK